MASRLKELRKAQGWSRYGFARAVDVDPVTVWRWEQDITSITYGNLKRCAALLKVAPIDIDPDLSLIPPLAEPTEEIAHV